MTLKDAKDRLANYVETENPPGTDYYGAEVDEDEVEAARERIEKTIESHEDGAGQGASHTGPYGSHTIVVTRCQFPLGRSDEDKSVRLYISFRCI